jgi:tRNA(Arg) A34 adenosine deaminase TadA
VSATPDDAANLRLAIELATESATSDGGPFGAIVVLEGAIVGRGTNRVTADRDPTLHAEVVAIREACGRTGRHDLAGAVLYASSEPCPMCFGAAWWARVDRIVFAAGRDDAAAAGFDDAAIFADVAAPPAERVLLSERLDLPESGVPFAAWEANPARTPY